MTRIILLIIALACLPYANAAAVEMAFSYSRSALTITRHHMPPPPSLLPWQKKEDAPPPANPNIDFNIEVRDAKSLYNQEGWYNFNNLAENSGLLLTFGVPTVAPISHANQYAPMDILFIDAQGKIIQIAPNIALAQLRQDLTPSEPILAFLFLQGGAAKKLSITPGDIVNYELFQKPPAILSEPEQQKNSGTTPPPSPNPE